MKKEKPVLSVWTWPYRKKYYLTHPWYWVRTLFVNIRCAHQRSVYGYCRHDWYDFDWWFTRVAPMMLRDMADKGQCYPGSEPFETPEKWHEWLHRMANQLEESYNDAYNRGGNDTLIKRTLSEMAEHWGCLWD